MIEWEILLIPFLLGLLAPISAAAAGILAEYVAYRTLISDPLIGIGVKLASLSEKADAELLGECYIKAMSPQRIIVSTYDGKAMSFFPREFLALHPVTVTTENTYDDT